MAAPLPDKKSRIYFEGLDSLRFIAITFVVLHHFFTFRNYYDDTVIDLPKIGLIGYYGIQFFFAGSGFLITYLLLKERKRYGSISLKKFYLRRILRIWPAYYVLIALVLLGLNYLDFFNIPHVTKGYFNADYKLANALYFLFMPHIAGNYFPTAPYIHQTYTIGMEEQFYFLWGLLFVYAFRRLKTIFWVFLLALPLLNGINYYAVEMNYVNDSGLFHKYFVLVNILCYFRIPTFALGALWAYSFAEEKKWTNIFSNKWFQVFCFLLITISITINLSPPFFRDEYIALLTLGFFSCFMNGKKGIINLEISWLKYLGKISYGIYLFHMIAVILTIKIFLLLAIDISKMQNVLLMLVCALGLSILFGWLSYISVETYFLNIKKRLRRV